jgi:predicted Zn-dependent protease
LREALGRDPLSVFTRSMLAQTLVLARRPEAAIDELRQVLELEPGFVFGHLTLALAHLARGAPREALDVLQRLPEPATVSQTPNYAGYLGYAQARLGNRAEAERILRDLLARFPGPWVPAVDVAAISVGLGDTDTALQWLERACTDRSFDSLLIVDDPRFLDLHADSRFRRLLQQMRQAVDRPAT